MMNKQHEQHITAALQQIEENCGQVLLTYLQEFCDVMVSAHSSDCL